MRFYGPCDLSDAIMALRRHDHLSLGQEQAVADFLEFVLDRWNDDLRRGYDSVIANGFYAELGLRKT